MLCGTSSARSGGLSKFGSVNYTMALRIVRLTGIDLRHGGGDLLLSLTVD